MDLYSYVGNDPLNKTDPSGLKGDACYAMSTGIGQVCAGPGLSGDDDKKPNGGASSPIAGLQPYAAAVGEASETLLDAYMMAMSVVAVEVAGVGKAVQSITSRVQSIHGALDRIAAGRRTTAVLETRTGTRIVGSGGRDLSPAQRVALKPGELAAKSPGAHAEATVLSHAAAMGESPASIAVTRTICPVCAALIEQTGGRLTSATTAVW